MRRLAEKNRKILIALGVRLAEAKRTLTPEGYDAFKRRERELLHGTKPGRFVVDKAKRLIRLASLQVLRDNIDKLPSTGWSTLRELPKLGESKFAARLNAARLTARARVRMSIRGLDGRPVCGRRHLAGLASGRSWLVRWRDE